METLTKVFRYMQYIPVIMIGFILFAVAIRIAAKISIRTFFEEKKGEKTKWQESQQNKEEKH